MRQPNYDKERGTFSRIADIDAPKKLRIFATLVARYLDIQKRDSLPDNIHILRHLETEIEMQLIEIL